MRQGYGTETFKDGSIYKGNHVNGLKSGKGFFKFADGATYEGDLLED